jgi:hypothetical protein
MLKAGAILAVALGLYSTGEAQTAHFSGASLVVLDGAHRIRLPGIISPHSEHRIVHAVQRRGSDYYIVIGVSEWSRGYPPHSGYCGAGIESHIDWLHVRDGKVVKRQSGLYESCLINRGDYWIEWKDGILCWNSKGLRHDDDANPPKFVWVNYTWKFDPARPEKGIEESAEEEQSARGQ